MLTVIKPRGEAMDAPPPVSASVVLLKLFIYYYYQASTKVERPNTRKQTRGTVVKKSVHVTGQFKLTVRTSYSIVVKQD